MPTSIWFALKKSLQMDCQTETTVKSPSKLRNGRCGGCSRSISSLRDVVNGCSSRRRSPPSDLVPNGGSSPRSMASSEFMNPITHEVVFNDSKCEIKIMGVGGTSGRRSVTGDTAKALNKDAAGISGGSLKGRSSSADLDFLGTLKPGTPGPRGDHGKRRTASGGGGGGGQPSTPPWGRLNSKGNNPQMGSSGSSSVLMCHKCGKEFTKLEAAEAHHLSNHAVTELKEGDSSRKIVEIICQASLTKPEPGRAPIERVVKVHNMQKTLARFEEHRETVKIRASKLSKKHPRCLADGNELLRFYGTVTACSLGSGLCSDNKCGVCRILRRGFPTKKEMLGSKGIFTTSTSGRALESTNLSVSRDEEEHNDLRRALLVCRVIAGRVHKALEDFRDMAVIPLGFDSVAGKVGCFSNIEELYVLNPKALLPCFVVIFRH